MSRESIVRWCVETANRNPRPYYCTGKNRFGPTCYDCSGFTFQAYYKGGGLTIPADSASVALWGKANGQIAPTNYARFGDLLIHDRYGDPYASFGPRGHIGIFDHFTNTGRVVSWESSGSGKGVAPQNRDQFFWSVRVQHPALAGPTALPKPPPAQEGDVTENNFFCRTDEAVPGAGEQWWCLSPEALTRIKVISPGHRDWIATLGSIRRKTDGSVDKSVPVVPASYLYPFASSE